MWVDCGQSQQKTLNTMSPGQAHKLQISFILNALKQAKGNISLAAKVTGLTRPTLYDMMKKNGITVQMEAKMEDKTAES